MLSSRSRWRNVGIQEPEGPYKSRPPDGRGASGELLKAAEIHFSAFRSTVNSAQRHTRYLSGALVRNEQVAFFAEADGSWLLQA